MKEKEKKIYINLYRMNIKLKNLFELIYVLLFVSKKNA